jgi:hypothetical protein
MCWWCVGSAGSGWYEWGGATTFGGSAAKSGGGGSRAVPCCCLVLWAAVALGPHDRGMGMGRCQHLCGVGLAMPRSIEVTAMLGHVACHLMCLGPVKP